MTITAPVENAAEVTARRYTVISADNHVVVPKAAFRPYVEERYRQAFEEEVAGEAQERALCQERYKTFLAHRSEPTDEERYLGWNAGVVLAEAAQVWEPDNWLKMNEAEGVVASVLFPAGSESRPPFEGWLDPDIDDELKEAGKRIYNRWLVDFCAAHPDRLAGVALPPSLDTVDEVVAGVNWAAEKGLRGGIWISPTLPENRPGLHDRVYDPVWAACQEADLPVNFHTDFGGGRPDPSTLYGSGPLAWAISNHERVPRCRPLWFLILGGVFERFPRLKVGFTEILAGWVPYEVQRLEDAFRDRSFTAINRLAPVRDMLTLSHREYWERNCFVGASFMSRSEAQIRHEIGLANIMWGSDFPHPEGTSPVTPEALRSTFAEVPSEEVAQMVGTNAARVYGFDLARLDVLAERVGPLKSDVAVPLLAPPAVHADKHVFGRGTF